MRLPIWLWLLLATVFFGFMALVGAYDVLIAKPKLRKASSSDPVCDARLFHQANAIIAGREPEAAHRSCHAVKKFRLERAGTTSGGTYPCCLITGREVLIIVNDRGGIWISYPIQIVDVGQVEVASGKWGPELKLFLPDGLLALNFFDSRERDQAMADLGGGQRGS